MNDLSRNVPLQVYLDSSDYSAFADSMKAGREKHAKIFQELCLLVEAGSIEVRFSCVHLFEMTQLDERYKSLALERIRCLKRLSRKKCFRFWLEANELECENLILGHDVCSGLRSESSFWHPDVSSIITALRRNFKINAKDITKKFPGNRHQRRALQRRFLPGGKLSKEAALAVGANGKSAGTEIANKFPFSRRFSEEDFLLKFATGEIEAGEIYDELLTIFSDVEVFIDWTYGHESAKKLSMGWLRDLGANFAQNLSKSRTSLEEARATFGSEKLKRELKRTIDQKIIVTRLGRLQELELSVARSIKSKKMKPPLPHASLLTLPLGSVPTLDAFLMALGEHAFRSATMTRTLKPSDAADVYHMAYLPYCDIFRADGDSANTARRIAKRFSVTVVPKIDDLLAAIRSYPKFKVKVSDQPSHESFASY